VYRKVASGKFLTKAGAKATEELALPTDLVE